MLRCLIQPVNIKLYLLLRGRAKLAGFARSLGGAHGEGEHEFVVALLLVGLDLTDKLVGESNDGLHPVTQLTVAEVLQQGAHLRERETEFTLKHLHMLSFTFTMTSVGPAA